MEGFLMDTPTWGQRVKTVRLKLNCTQVQLAQRLEINPITIARWEKMSDRPYSREAELFLALELDLEDGEPS